MIPNQEEMGPPPSRGRTARASLSSPFPPDANRWEPLGCGQCVGCSVWAGGRAWQSQAEPDRAGQSLAEPGRAGQPRPAGSELLPGMSHRNLGVGREAKGSAGGSALSHLISSRLISSFAAFRGRFNLPARGSGSPCSAGCIPMPRGSPRPARDTGGSLAPPRRGHEARGHAWGWQLRLDRVSPPQQGWEVLQTHGSS